MIKKKTEAQDEKIHKVYNLIGVYENDIWELRNCGFKYIQSIMPDNPAIYKEIDFCDIKNEVIKKELKYFIFNRLINFKGIYNTLRQNFLCPVRWLIKYLEINSENIKTLSKIDKSFEDNYKKFLLQSNVNITYRKNERMNKSYLNDNARLPFRIRNFLIDEYNRAEGKSPDAWNITDFNISQHRINYSRAVKTIRFYSILNEVNKNIIKDYVKYLFYDTEISVDFITAKYFAVKEFAIFLQDKNLSEVERKDIEDFKQYLLDKNIDDRTYNKRLIDLSNFYRYGIEKKLWNQNHIYMEYDLFNSPFKIRGDTVENIVIEQMFKNREYFSKRDFTIFLILYCCGMRISEVCILKKNNIRKDESGYYIVFYVQKMKKEASNPIPKSLYEHIKEYSKEVEGEYLFTKADGSPLIANTYKDTMNRIIAKCQIKNSDGTLYNFRPHEYRHTFATSLLERDIPFTVIQKLLHHNSPEMSLVYTQISDSRKRKKYIEFVDKVGKKSKNLFNEEENEKIYEVQWLKNNLKSQALPNGFCSLPVSLGVCPYANACLTCDYFKSTKGHLSILKKQLIRTNALIEILKEKKLNEQLIVNLEVKKNLETIISSIEEGE